MSGSNARAEERVREIYSIELIDQKIREAGEVQKAAKSTLASLIQRERAESGQIYALQGRADRLISRAKRALENDSQDLAQEAAQAVANMENELVVRRETACRVETRILQLRQSVEASNRRIIDLKQGAIAARAVRKRTKHSAAYDPQYWWWMRDRRGGIVDRPGDGA
ncbi:MAG: phage shock protein A [Paracoccaceae bacterium]